MVSMRVLACVVRLVLAALFGIDVDPSTPLAASGERRREPDPGPQHIGPCDPLEVTTRPVTLADPIVVAQAEDDTLFVVDRLGAIDMRSFIGTDGSLQRVGNGFSVEADTKYEYILFAVPDAILGLRLRRAASRAGKFRHSDLAMLLLPKGTKVECADWVTEGDPLALVSPDTIDDWTVHNAPDHIYPEYLARTDDDRWLMVTRTASSEYTFTNLRLFFGPSDHVQEYELVTFARQRDGGTTDVVFDLDGERVTAHFPVHCGSAQEIRRPRLGCPGVLMRERENATLEQLPRGTSVPRQLRFVCDPP
jgi:hypothetical protein